MSKSTTIKLSMKAQLLAACEEILREHGPLHYRSLYTHVQEKQIAVGGNDPAYTVYAHVFVDLKNEEDSKFIMCGKGVFGLAGEHENVDISSKVPARTRQEKVMTIAEIDAEILRLTQMKEHIIQEQAALKAERKTN